MSLNNKYLSFSCTIDQMQVRKVTVSFNSSRTQIGILAPMLGILKLSTKIPFFLFFPHVLLR